MRLTSESPAVLNGNWRDNLYLQVPMERHLNALFVCLFVNFVILLVDFFKVNRYPSMQGNVIGFIVYLALVK